jgi:integration host factor subunit beta
VAAGKYTKAEIVDSIYDKTGINRSEIRTVIDLFIDGVKEALTRRRVIELRKFGTFEVRVRKGRKEARNPKTGELFTVHSHGIVSFRPGQELKQEVWNLVPEYPDNEFVSEAAEPVSDYVSSKSASGRQVQDYSDKAKNARR